MAVIDISQYAKMNEEFGDKMYRIWGPTLIGFPSDTDSSRALMATSQQKQFLTLLNPDVPHVLTGFENAFGKYNRSYLRMKGQWEIIDKIDKFGDGMIFTLVLYNAATRTYDMVEKVVTETKTEKFGFLYNTEAMDKMEPGDKIEDAVLYRSTSYDEHMNYRLGKNALVMYSTSNPTIEDAIYVRKGWADSVQFVELDTVTVPLNNNDIFINRYGDDNTYKPFPSIGEHVVDSVLCTTRRVVKDHLLYDFQSRNLRQSCSTDVDYFTSKKAMVYDINVYYNGDEPFPNNLFHRELGICYEACCSYADRLTEVAQGIKEKCKKNPRYHYTQNIPFIISKYQHVSDPQYKWKIKANDREFSHILVTFKTYAVVSLQAGYKLVGRYGDKGVISKVASDGIAEDTGENAYIEEVIKKGLVNTFEEELTPEEMAKISKNFHVVEDSEMPYMEDGTKVDILLNASGAIRRLNNGQLDEVDLAFQMECIRKEICKTEDLDEKYDLLFRFLEIVNKDEYKFFYGKYAAWSQRVTIEGKTIRFLDQAERRRFMDDVEKNGIYLVKPPDAHIRYDTVKAVYDAFPFIEPVQLYIDKFGIARKRIMRKCIVGTKYMYALKQTSNKNFSARSMGRVDKKGLPQKSTDKRDNRAEISHNPLKLGEVHNLMASISGRTMAEHNIFTRSSPVGRKSLVKILQATGDPAKIHRLKIKDSYRNVNADIFNAYIKTWGIRVNFFTDVDGVEDVYMDVVQPFQVHGYTVLDRPSTRETYARCFDAYEAVKNDMIVVLDDQMDLNSFLWNEVFAKEDFKDTEPYIQEVCRGATIGAYVEMDHTVDEDEDE
jgi:hypothetical protein